MKYTLRFLKLRYCACRVFLTLWQIHDNVDLISCFSVGINKNDLHDVHILQIFEKKLITHKYVQCEISMFTLAIGNNPCYFVHFCNFPHTRMLKKYSYLLVRLYWINKPWKQAHCVS